MQYTDLRLTGRDDYFNNGADIKRVVFKGIITAFKRIEMREEVNTKLMIRQGKEEDIRLIRSVAETAFPATYGAILSPGQIEYMMEWMYSSDNIRKQMEEGHIYYLAFMEDVPVGYVSVQKEREGLFHLHKIYVLPERQGFGIGETLFRRVIEHIREAAPGGARMELNVNRHNKALGFYRRLGMEIAGEGDFDIGNGYFMNDYIMALDVDPSVR